MSIYSTSKKYGLTPSQRHDVNHRVMSAIEGMHKVAAAGAAKATTSAGAEAAKTFAIALGGSAAGAAVAYGMPAAINAVREARLRSNRDKFISNMKKVHPELSNFSKRDVDIVYNSLAIHAPNLLRDPLVGGQVLLDSLTRGRRMDVSTLSNVSKLTGGSGIGDPSRDAVKILSSGTERGISNAASAYYRAATKVDDVAGSTSGNKGGNKGGKKR